VPRRGCCSPVFAYFLGVWQGPEFMGINIESDSLRSFLLDHTFGIAHPFEPKQARAGL
jgi:hypothetical protein